MRKSKIASCLLLFAFVFALSAVAQDQPKAPEPGKVADVPARFYHLEFVVQELGTDGKPTNSRTYTTTISTEDRGSASIRTKSKVPIATGPTATSNSSALVSTQWQYVDVGVDIDASHAREIGRQVALNISADVSSVAEARDPNLHAPVVRQNRWQAVVLIPTGKSTVLFSSDALDSKGSMQLVVTASPLQ